MSYVLALNVLIVCCTSLHLKIVLSIVLHLILAIFVVYGEWVNLAIVSAWHLVLWIFLLYQQQYIFSLSSDKLRTYCKLLWIKASAKCPKCRCKSITHRFSMDFRSLCQCIRTLRTSTRGTCTWGSETTGTGPYAVCRGPPLTWWRGCPTITTGHSGTATS